MAYTLDEFAADCRRILEADPTTDWSWINLATLLEHLIDMHEVTLNAVVRQEPVPGGARFAVEGTGRTREDSLEHAVRLLADRYPTAADAKPFLDRLRIDYGRGRAIMISPEDKRGFLIELERRSGPPGVEVGAPADRPAQAPACRVCIRSTSPK